MPLSVELLRISDAAIDSVESDTRMHVITVFNSSTDRNKHSVQCLMNSYANSTVSFQRTSFLLLWISSIANVVSLVAVIRRIFDTISDDSNEIYHSARLSTVRSSRLNRHIQCFLGHGIGTYAVLLYMSCLFLCRPGF
jgi:hypothetical protein